MATLAQRSGGIALDREETWPMDLRRMLDSNLAMLREHRRIQNGIDRLCERDIGARCNPPPNPQDAARNHFVEECQRYISTGEIVGYHCTRLHESDIVSIEKDGLLPLERTHAHERIARLVRAGKLTETTSAKLTARNDAADSNRSGMIWFVFTVDCLREELGVGPLFTFWGGEALYHLHKQDVGVAAELRAIGTACIVEARVPTVAINGFLSMGERLLNRYLHKQRIRTRHGPSAEGYVRVVIPPVSIARVIRRSNRDFRRLTWCGGWTIQPT